MCVQLSAFPYRLHVLQASMYMCTMRRLLSPAVAAFDVPLQVLLNRKDWLLQVDKCIFRQYGEGVTRNASTDGIESSTRPSEPQIPADLRSDGRQLLCNRLHVFVTAS